MNSYYSNLSKLYNITKILYTNLCDKDSKDNSKFNKIWSTVQTIYNELFENEDENDSKFDKLCRINRLLYMELLVVNDDKDSKNYAYIYEKIYDYIICILYNLKEPQGKRWDALIQNLNDIFDKNEENNKVLTDDIKFIRNVMKIYKVNEDLQRLCMKCISKIAINLANFKLLDDNGILRDIEISLFSGIYNKWEDIQIQIYYIFTNISRSEEGREYFSINTIKEIKRMVSENIESTEILKSIFVCLSNLCLKNSNKDEIGKHEFLLIIKNIFSKNIDNDKFISSIILIFINLCSELELDEFPEKICITEFPEILIKYLSQYLLRIIPYDELIITKCIQCLLSMSNSISFKHHFLSGSGIELLYLLRNMDHNDFIYRDKLFTYIDELLDELKINGELIFDENYSSLHIASLNGDVKTIYKILKNTNIDINSKDIHGNTSLHIAVEYNRKQIIQYLTICGIDIYIKNSDNKNVFNICQRKNLNKDIKNFNKIYKIIKSNVINELSNIMNLNSDVPGIIFQYYDIYTNVYINHNKRSILS
ncbi:MAG: hypothetical protein CMF12_09450 [Idiomarina sp.]|mgnify:CR=1 FL=1|nr:hypothetical protein [Idiomarina sp.]